MRLLVARFAGVEESDEHRLRQALRYMEEPVMLAEAITEWRQEAIAEGRTEGIRQGRSEGIRQGRSEGVREGTSEGRRTLLRRQATRRYGLEAGEEFGRLLAGEEDADRLELAGDLVIDCSSAEELLRRGVACWKAATARPDGRVGSLLRNCCADLASLPGIARARWQFASQTAAPISLRYLALRGRVVAQRYGRVGSCFATAGADLAPLVRLALGVGAVL